jgi:hypothetical protein
MPQAQATRCAASNLAALVAAICLSAALSNLAFAQPGSNRAADSRAADSRAVDSRALSAAESFERVVSDVIDACGPSVVAIAQDRRRRDASDRPSPFDVDPAG